ncbi:MAG: hypothetical protein Q8L88_00280, partial [Bacteroidota bacterium]|nr:hypothetical protein [Bacteroidota bacterium]
TQLVPDLSPIIVNLIQRCLEKDPAERYQHFDDITADLKRAMRKTSRVMRSSPNIQQIQSDQKPVATQSGIQSKISPGIFEKTSVRIGGSVAVVTIIALIVWFVFGNSLPKINPDMSTSILQIPATEYQYPDMSPDGKWLAFPGSDVKGNWDIYMMFIETGESRRLTNDSSADLGNAATAQFSPDGSSIAYGRNRAGKNISEICVVSVLTGSSRVIADSGIAPFWSPSGDRIFYYRGGRNNRNASRSGWREYWSVTPQGTDAKIEFIDSLMKGSLRYFTLKVSPDGKKILFTRPLEGDYNEIFIRDIATGNETKITDDKKTIDEAIILKNGYILYSSNRSGNFNIWAIPENGGEATQITRGAGPDYGISFSNAANRLIFSQRTETSTLWMVNTDGTENRQVYPDENINRAHISPDGKSIAMQILSPILLDALMIRDINGGRQEILFPFHPSISREEPIWSPSGKLLAFMEFRLKEEVEYLNAKIIDISGGRRIQDLGEGIVDHWISDSIVTIVRNSSKNAKQSIYNETHLLNIRTGEDKVFFRDTMYAFPLLNNSAIGYLNGLGDSYIITRQELLKNPNAQGNLLLRADEKSRAIVSQSTAYYVLKNRSALWKINLRTRKKSKIMNIPPGDNLRFYRTEYADKVLTYTKQRRKTSIVKIDNLFLK